MDCLCVCECGVRVCSNEIPAVTSISRDLQTKSVWLARRRDRKMREPLELVLWKRLNTETPQHGNGPKSEFGSVSFFFQELSEIPQKLKSVEGFPDILGRFPLYLHLIRFPFFLGPFPLFFGSVSSFILGPFLIFRKKL